MSLISGLGMKQGNLLKLMGIRIAFGGAPPNMRQLLFFFFLFWLTITLRTGDLPHSL